MMNYLDVMDVSERISLSLRSIYKNAGFYQYKMSKFEEYDFYSKNKSFLVSDNIITFTDTTGKLMALKPDVTLSIVKNNRDVQGTAKLYYDENVYRVSKGTGAFKEIKQVGLEAIGDIDSDCIAEVISLALKSLNEINSDFVLDVSNIDILSSVISDITEDEAIAREITKCVSEKNVQGIDKVLASSGIDTSKADKLKKLTNLYGAPEKVMPTVKEIVGDCDAYKILEQAINSADSELKSKINVDFSIVSNTSYYNGITFKGFVKSAPDSILSGGQYDKLMRRMKRTQNAIGFAVYLDMIERFANTVTEGK